MKIVGKPVNRVGGKERVLGTQEYVGDIKLPGMLHGKLVTLDCARARIDRIHLKRALMIRGVRKIFTAADFPEDPRFGPQYRDRPVLAGKETKFHGEPVAFVVAESIEAANRAAALITVDYEILSAVLSPAAALDPDAPLVQDPSLRKEMEWKNSNILNQWVYGWGNIEVCRADRIIENTYKFPMVTHFAIESFCYLADPSSEGITLYSAIQNPFQLQKIIADVTGFPLSRVRIIAPDPGGAFGGKQHPKHEPLLVLASLMLGEPIRLELSLEESFQAVRRAASEIRIKTGFMEDGTLVFHDIQSDFLAGAYGDIAGRVVSKANFVAAGLYRTPHVRITANALLSHTVPSTAFRGFGIPQVNWALESQMDEIAVNLGMDRVAIRMKNLPEKGEVFIPGNTPADGCWKEVLQKAADAIGWNSPLKPNRGRGLTMGLKMGATTAASYAIVRLHMDGSATVFAGTSDMGQGARTIFSQIVSEMLGIDMAKITMVMGDTGAVPFDLQTSASRSTVFMGKAIQKACDEVIGKVQILASEVMGIEPVQLAFEPGFIRHEKETVPIDTILKKRFTPVKGEVIGVGEARSEYLPDHPMGGLAAFYEIVALGTEVEVDRETGFTRIKKMIITGDVGKAVNLQHVEMQDEGAAVMGIGHSIMEQMILDDNGKILNLGALDYRIPTIMDIPDEMRSIVIENGDGPGPYGAKGCSESGILTVAPSIAAAVYEAVGVRIRDLPLSPEKIWKSLNP